MPGPEVLAVRTGKQQAMPARLDVEDRDARIVDAGSRHPHREKKLPAARQHLRQPVPTLSVCGVEHRQCDRLTALCRHAEQRRRPARRKQDRVVGSPARAGRRAAGVSDHERIAARRRHALDLSAGEEPNPSSVGRQERRAGAFGSGNRNRIESMEIASVQPAFGDVHEKASVGRDDRCQGGSSSRHGETHNRLDALGSRARHRCADDDADRRGRECQRAGADPQRSPRSSGVGKPPGIACRTRSDLG